MAAVIGASTEWEDEAPPYNPNNAPKPVQLTHGRLSVSMARRPSNAGGGTAYGSPSTNAAQFEHRKHRLPAVSVVQGRPARVFWDLDSCPVGGLNYFNEIIKSIDFRVSTDIRQDIFEIYAAYGSRRSLPPEICQELQSFDVNFNLVEADSADQTKTDARQKAVDDDIYEQIGRFIKTQSQRSHLYPYILLITGSVDLLNRMETLERQAKIVYAVRKERVSQFKSGSSLCFEYSTIRGIDNLKI